MTQIAHHDWVVVCDGTKVIALENMGDEAFLNLRKVYARQQENAPTHEQGSDAPGRSVSAIDGRKSGMEQTDWHSQAEHLFLESVVSGLDKALSSGTAKHFIIVAPPEALGVLREFYSPAVKRAVKAELAKDYVNIPLPQIEEYLARTPLA